jgi:uncharacterized membrane protein YdjX (TVP38/TMEM64 family)
MTAGDRRAALGSGARWKRRRRAQEQRLTHASPTPAPSGPAGKGRRLAARLLPLALLVAAGILFVAFGGTRYLSFEALARHSARLHGLVARAPLATALGFVLLYAGLTALSVPGAAVLTVTGGFLFGTWLGLLCAVSGATLGASLLFLAARAGLGGLAARAGPFARRLEAGFRRNAFNYLLVLRLIPLFPFWLVNLVAALTGMRLSSFVVATFLGIIPGSFVFASLGHGVASVVGHHRALGLHVFLRPSVLVPIVGLAVLALVPVVYRTWRGRHAEDAA